MNNHELDLPLLRCFAALVGERSVSRAANSLDMSQPAMSRALARLRRIFGDPLLLRGKGDMIATERALQLESEVQRVLQSADELTRKPAAFDPVRSRMRFSIMTSEPIEYLLAARLMERLREAPGIDIEFLPADRGRAPGLLERGEIDFRLGWWPNPAPMLRHQMLFRDRIACLVRKSHTDIRGRLTLERFLALPHVRIRSANAGPSMQAVDDAVAALHKKLRIAVRTHGISSLVRVICSSDAIATIPESLARLLARDNPLQVLAVPIAMPDLRNALYWHERTHRQPSHRWFRQLLSEVARA